MKHSRKLNIGIVTTWFERGAAYVSKAYLDTLSRQHNVFIYARGGEAYARADSHWDKDYVTWGQRVRIGVPNFVAWNEFRNWVTQYHLDVVIFNEQQSWDIILRSLRLDILIGAYVDYYTRDTVPFFWLYDFLLCNTRRHYSVFKNHPQALSIPWGTDCTVFDGTYQPVSEASLMFFHSCGGSYHRKGTDLLVRAFQRVHGDARLVIHSQGSMKHNSLIEFANQDPRIEVIEKEVSAPGLYHLGDVYVYPSRLEGIGLTMAEALASGLPVITTDNAPMNEFVVHGLNGRLVPAEKFQRRADDYYWEESICSEEALAQAMQYYVDHRQQLAEFKLQARQYAEEHLDWAKNSAELPGQIVELHRQAKPSALIRAVAWYEYSHYPALVVTALKRKLLRATRFGSYA